MDFLNLNTHLLLIVLMLIYPSKQFNSRSLTKEEVELENSKARQEREDQLAFPGSTEHRDVSDGNKFRDGRSPVTPCPDNQPFCSSVDDYPEEEIKQLIRTNHSHILDHFYVDIIDVNTDRVGPAEIELCPTQTQIMFPEKGKSVEGVYEIIVNTDKYRQGIKVETCVQRKDKSCNSIINGVMNNGYRTECVQKSVTRILVVADQSNGGVKGFVSKPFDFPSCCSCVLIGPFADRFAQSPAVPANTTITNPQ